MRRIVRATNCPCDELSATNCPRRIVRDELSVRRIVQSPYSPSFFLVISLFFSLEFYEQCMCKDIVVDSNGSNLL